MDSFGDIVQQYADKKAMSHRSLASALGIAHALVSFIVKGERTCPLENLEQWIEVLEVPPKKQADFKDAAIRTHANCCGPLEDLLQRLYDRIDALEKK
jgi:cyanate lyase